VLDGELEHRDSLGSHGVVPPGGVQYVSAGSGVAHSEFNHSSEKPVHFVQMWVLPRTLGHDPAYGQREFDAAHRTGRWLTVAGGEAGVPAPIVLGADATLRVARLEGGSLSFDLRAERFGYIFVASGEITANGERLTAGDAIRASGEQQIVLSGTGELVAWDVPPVEALVR